jgi:phage terminase large subunit-like protein
MSALLPRLRGLDTVQRRRLFAALNPAELASLDDDWREWAHAGQQFPPLSGPGGDWRTWVLMAGRGFGKTRTGAAWVHDLVRRNSGARIALVAATVEEARRIMIEGPSGLLATAPAFGLQPRFEPARGRVVWTDGAGRPGGAVAALYSGANPAGLRGPEHHYAWCDELAKWRHPDAAWDMLQLGLRLGTCPRALVTTTPRAGVAVLKRLLGAADTVVTGGSSDANPHVAPAWVAAMRGTLGTSRLGRQELDGMLLEDVAGSLWPLALLDACREGGAQPPRGALARVVIGVDPPASAGGTCGIVACGLDRDGRGHVLADHSAEGLSPEGWAGRVAAAAAAHAADRVVVETNQGGDMVRAVLRAADAVLPVQGVTARAGKGARAEPVAALFEAGRVRLCGHFPALEEQLTGMTPRATGTRGYEGPGASPDRADAMVWALWALLIAPRAEPRISLG